MSSKSRGRGITAIELVNAAAIVGVLVSAGVPAYQDYTRREKVSALVAAAYACRTTAVGTMRSLKGPVQAQKWGCGSASAPSKYVASVLADAAGTITATSQNIGPGANGSIELRPCSNAAAATFAGCQPVAAGGTVGSWLCGPATTGRPIQARFLPGSCRSTP